MFPLSSINTPNKNNKNSYRIAIMFDYDNIEFSKDYYAIGRIANEEYLFIKLDNDSLREMFENIDVE